MILWVLWVHGPGTAASITALLKSHDRLANRRWPASALPYGRSDPYEGGVYQYLGQMRRKAWVLQAVVGNGSLKGFAWNPAVLTPRAHAQDVLDLRRHGHDNQQIASELGIAAQRVSAIYHDPFGLAEAERKKRYCPGCGAPKDTEDQTTCTNCVRKKREEREDLAESLLPDPEWAAGLKVNVRVDFAVTDDHCRLLILHTDRGRAEIPLARGESWETAIADAGVLS